MQTLVMRFSFVLVISYIDPVLTMWLEAILNGLTAFHVCSLDLLPENKISMFAFLLGPGMLAGKDRGENYWCSRSVIAVTYHQHDRIVHS